MLKKNDNGSKHDLLIDHTENEHNTSAYSGTLKKKTS
jgi:hypothetical protein